jgi:hypothetical protein
MHGLMNERVFTLEILIHVMSVARQGRYHELVHVNSNLCMTAATQKKTIGFATDKRFVHRARELTTISAMLDMYCRAHHGGAPAALCASCAELFQYASRRLERCVFGDAKPTCANCIVHCYSAEMREQVRVVMRWAGPRMLLRHPLLGIRHLLDGRRPVPTLPEKRAAPR